MTDSTDDVAFDIDSLFNPRPDSYSGSGEEFETEIECLCIRESPKALLCQRADDKKEFWVPKSGIRSNSEVQQRGDEGLLVIHDWLAKARAEEAEKGETRDEDKARNFVKVSGVSTVLKETDRGLLVRLDDGKEVWFPKSAIDPDSEVQFDGDCGELRVEDWIAKAKGLE